MGHTVGPSAADTRAHSHQPIATLPLAYGDTLVAALAGASPFAALEPPFKRPHDPPHLHTFSLLI
jgi:hypothetical protein